MENQKSDEEVECQYWNYLVVKLQSCCKVKLEDETSLSKKWSPSKTFACPGHQSCGYAKKRLILFLHSVQKINVSRQEFFDKHSIQIFNGTTLSGFILISHFSCNAAVYKEFHTSCCGQIFLENIAPLIRCSFALNEGSVF